MALTDIQLRAISNVKLVEAINQAAIDGDTVELARLRRERSRRRAWLRRMTTGR